ncbi:hypothetical protein FQA39_LY10250 [Lamprigera yunnana]|nr:hypothetical protein FQA39_LY10250 [Lamprigera yunnana]
MEMDLIHIRKPKEFDINQLHKWSKEDLIEKVKALHCHNIELKNVIAKSKGPGKKSAKHLRQKAFDFTKCHFRHILLKIMYLGWDYQGYASQENSGNTVEFHVFEALMKTCLIRNRQTSNYHRCGRTDKGVSSFGQVISIDVRSQLAPDNQDDIDNEINYCGILNKVLPAEIRCIAWCPVNDDFSARFDCKLRTYKYFFPKAKLDIEKMEIAATYFLGTHDFRNFCKMDVGNGVLKFLRTVTDISIKPYSINSNNDECSVYVLTIEGQAFLWHQIRCVMGVLLLVGRGKEKPQVITDLLDVETNSRKPDYNMASEIPLNLYECQYDLETEWIYDCASLSNVIYKLQNIWTIQAMKSTMIEHMLQDLQSEEVIVQNREYGLKYCQINCLLNGVTSKKYTPLLQRQKCVCFYIQTTKMSPMKLQTTSNVVHDDSDGDLSPGESEHTNSSRENDAVHDTSEGDEADSDDSSEMDEDECETRRNECMQNLSDLEHQFTCLREQLYRERIAQVDHQLAEVKGGRSQEYLGPLHDLQCNMRVRTEVAGILRQLRLANIRNKFDAEEQAARQNFESEKSLVWDILYEDLMNTIRHLEEDRHNSELTWGEGGEWASRSRSRSRRKAVTVSGPYIVYLLKPQDIMEDWTIIRKALKRSS